MKKLSFFFIALSLVAFTSLNSCKTSTKPAAEDETEVVEEEMVEETAEEVADTTMADTTAAMVEEATETAE